MKYSVRVGDHLYHVEIKSLKSRPIIATVDGVEFEIMPEDGETAGLSPVDAAIKSAAGDERTQVPASGAVPSGSVLETSSVRAPIPGVIIEVKVKPGEEVEFGQALFVIEAMKMRNAIRASRTGIVGEVFVSTGETVVHNQQLMCFTE